MTDNTDIKVTAGTLKRAANRFHRRKDTPDYFILFHWPYVLLHEAGYRNHQALADLYLNLLGITWDHGTITKQGLPKATLRLKPLRESMDMPTRTFQNQLQQLEELELIKRKRIPGDRMNGNRTRMIVWAPKYTLEFLSENDQNSNEIKIGFPYFGVPDNGLTVTPCYRSSSSNRNSSNSTAAAANSGATKNSETARRKKRLARAAARKKRSDGSDRRRQSKRPISKNSQTGLVSWYCRKIRRIVGYDPPVNIKVLRTQGWTAKRWKLTYEVLATIIADWDVFMESQSDMKTKPAYPPLEWLNSWWNGWLGWHNAHHGTTTKKRKLPTSGKIVLK